MNSLTPRLFKNRRGRKTRVLKKRKTETQTKTNSFVAALITYRFRQVGVAFSNLGGFLLLFARQKEVKKITILLILAIFAGCNPADKFTLVEAEMPTMYGLRSVHGTAVVESTAGRDFMIESALITVIYKERDLVTARLMQPVELPAGEISHIRYDFALENTTLLRLQTLASRIPVEPSGLTADLKAWVRYGGIRRKVEIEGITKSDIIAIFGLY